MRKNREINPYPEHNSIKSEIIPKCIRMSQCSFGDTAIPASHVNETWDVVSRSRCPLMKSTNARAQVWGDSDSRVTGHISKANPVAVGTTDREDSACVGDLRRESPSGKRPGAMNETGNFIAGVSRASKKLTPRCGTIPSSSEKGVVSFNTDDNAKPADKHSKNADKNNAKRVYNKHSCANTNNATSVLTQRKGLDRRKPKRLLHAARNRRNPHYRKRPPREFPQKRGIWKKARKMKTSEAR